MALSCTVVLDIFDFEKCSDLEIRTPDHSRLLEMTLFGRTYMTYYESLNNSNINQSITQPKHIYKVLYVTTELTWSWSCILHMLLTLQQQNDCTTVLCAYVIVLCPPQQIIGAHRL